MRCRVPPPLEQRPRLLGPPLAARRVRSLARRRRDIPRGRCFRPPMVTLGVGALRTRSVRWEGSVLLAAPRAPRHLAASLIAASLLACSGSSSSGGTPPATCPLPSAAKLQV